MWKWLNATLMKFEDCFRRSATFGLFAIIVIGLMIRSDHLGISSIAREFSFDKNAYMSMLHFFRSEGWNILNIQRAWLNILKDTPLLIKEAGRYVLIGDGVKQSKEGRKMPGVMKLHQESDNSSKKNFIHGHMFGGLGILAGNGVKLYCVLISLRLHDGIAALRRWRQGEDYIEESHVEKMVRDAGRAVRSLGDSILLLDRLFLTVPMLTALLEVPGLAVVTKAKSNAVAYHQPGPYKGRGAKPKKGQKVKIADLFAAYATQFTHTQMDLYGKTKNISYFSIDLLWGKKLYQPLKFVLTIMDGAHSILVSTDLTLSPAKIIDLYCMRFKIECSFRELKQVVAGFSYHFWSKSMLKLMKYKNNDVNQTNLENIADPNKRRLIESTVNAIEGFAGLSAIALGLLQIIGLLFGSEIVHCGRRFMRTVSNNTPSERTVADYMRKNIYMLFRFFPELTITALISARQKSHYDPSDDLKDDSVA